MIRRPALAAMLAALVLAGCAMPSNRERLAPVKRLGIIEPQPTDAYVKMGTVPGPTPVLVPGSAAAVGPAVVGTLIGGAIIAGIEGVQARHADGVTVRFRESCPDTIERSATMRREVVEKLKAELSGRFEPVVVTLSEAAGEAPDAEKLRNLDAYLVFAFDASLWAGSPWMDYWPVIRGGVTVVNPEGKRLFRPQEVRVSNRPGLSFPSADDVVTRCKEALAALEALTGPFAQRIKFVLESNPQETQ